MPNLLAAVFASLSSDGRNLASCQLSFSLRSGASANRRCSTLLLAAMIVLAGMAGLCVSANAQVRFGTILGIVDDPSGAIVSGATVKLINLDTNETRTVQTSSAGAFTFPNLIAGLYRVDVEMTGFKRFVQDKVEVQVDVTTRVDARLQVGNTSESVTVTTEAPPLQTDSASLGTVISQQEVESIP